MCLFCKWLTLFWSPAPHLVRWVLPGVTPKQSEVCHLTLQKKGQNCPKIRKPDNFFQLEARSMNHVIPAPAWLIVQSLRCWKYDLSPKETSAPNPCWHFKNRGQCSAWPCSGDLLAFHGWFDTGFPQLHVGVLLGCLSHFFHGRHSHHMVVQTDCPARKL